MGDDHIGSLTYKPGALYASRLERVPEIGWEDPNEADFFRVNSPGSPSRGRRVTDASHHQRIRVIVGSQGL